MRVLLRIIVTIDSSSRTGGMTRPSCQIEVDPAVLRPVVPFPLDLHGGKAYVTLVAFTLEKMRPRRGGRLGRWLLTPVANHRFLNVRTYVRHNGEPGIHFLAEWLSSWLAVKLGPRTFSLPYRHGRIRYKHDWQSGRLSGRVEDAQTHAVFQYRAGPEIGAPAQQQLAGSETGTSFTSCEPGSRDEWLMERYTAFTHCRGASRFFRVWHPPWPQLPAQIELTETSLLRANWPWLAAGEVAGANYSPGFRDVWMGRPHRLHETM